MHTSSKPVFVSDNGQDFDNIEDAAKASARYAMERLVGGPSSHYDSAIDLLADRWYVLHSELLRINKERCEIADANGV